MTRVPRLHQVSVSRLPLSDAIRELDRHQDAVRIAFDSRRTYLAKLSQSREPVDGELLYTADGELFLCVGKNYTKLYPVEVEVKGAVPEWFSDYILLLEEKLARIGIPKSEWKYYGGGV